MLLRSYRCCRGCQLCPVLMQSNQGKACSACNCRVYCSRECQKKDWKQHKPECKVLVARTKSDLHGAALFQPDPVAETLQPDGSDIACFGD